MKEILNKFTCDFCGKKIERTNDEGSPVNVGWFSLRKISLYVPPIGRCLDVGDKDFCSGECMNKFIGVEINELNQGCQNTKEVKNEFLDEENEKLDENKKESRFQSLFGKK